MPRILVVDDEKERTEQIADWFGTISGYEVLRAHSIEEGLKAATSELPDLIILDIVFPEDDLGGLTALRRLKRSARTERIPVVICSFKGNEIEGLQDLTLTGLREGADYVIARKWGLPALEEVVTRLLAEPAQSTTITVEGHRLRLGAGCVEVWVDDQRIQLTPMMARLLCYLNEHRGQPCSVESIVRDVWRDKGVVGDDVRARRMVERLRNTIEPHRPSPIFVVTVPGGNGYQLVNGDEEPH